MATAQKQRNSSAVVFPTKIATEQQSLMLVKRLLAVAVSCITYLRGIFPESAYRTRYMDDVSVKILREDKNCPGSTQLVKWYGWQCCLKWQVHFWRRWDHFSQAKQMQIR
uniref:HORMA domain-containing protein 1 n=1 Tax=Amazona collaria TaxID=241587 RepID=A0A8B9GMP4_9PSIT